MFDIPKLMQVLSEILSDKYGWADLVIYYYFRSV